MLQDLRTERLKELEEKVKKLKWKVEGNTRHINLQNEAHRKAMFSKEELISNLVKDIESDKVAAITAQCTSLQRENEKLVGENQGILEKLLWEQRQVKDRAALAKENEKLAKRVAELRGSITKWENAKDYRKETIFSFQQEIIANMLIR